MCCMLVVDASRSRSSRNKTTIPTTVHFKELSDIIEETESSVEKEQFEDEICYEDDDFFEEEEEEEEYEDADAEDNDGDSGEENLFLFQDASATMMEDIDESPSNSDNEEGTSVTSNSEEDDNNNTISPPSSPTSPTSPSSATGSSTTVMDQVWTLMVSLVVMSWVRDHFLLAASTSRRRALTNATHKNNSNNKRNESTATATATAPLITSTTTTSTTTAPITSNAISDISSNES
jgi:hypothetical protein